MVEGSTGVQQKENNVYQLLECLHCRRKDMMRARSPETQSMHVSYVRNETELGS